MMNVTIFFQISSEAVAVGQNYVQDASINYQRCSQSTTPGPLSAKAARGAEGDVQHSTTQTKRSRDTAGAREGDVHYVSVRFKKVKTAHM